MDFNAYWAALPTGGWHIVLARKNCNMFEAWNGRQCLRYGVMTSVNPHHDFVYRGGRSQTGVDRIVTEKQKYNWGNGNATSRHRSVVCGHGFMIY